MTQPLSVRCPQCGTPHIWSTDNPWRPFCSERCKQIDLGAWANEEYRLPVAGEVDDGANVAPPVPFDAADK